MTANAAMGENKRCRPVEDLLPGIVDDIVLNKIVPKLEWKDFYILSSVSCAWYNAIRSRRVFDSRVLSHTSETFVGCWVYNTIALYSMRDNSWHNLPRIADICQGQDRIPRWAQCVSMDGKIYVLGGTIGSEISSKVFVFDLAGQGHWEQCASTKQEIQGRWEQCTSMKQRRQGFGTAVMDGKIYVFGGKTRSTLRSSEVYEPKEDTWSPISHMATCQFGELITPVGEELFIFGGLSFDVNRNREVSLEAYHPFKDEWRVVQRPWNRPQCGLVFAAHGSVFSIETDYTHGHLGSRLLALRKYNVHGNSWTHVCSFSLAELIPVEYRPWAWKPDAVLAVDDELIAIVSCVKKNGDEAMGQCLFESTGLCSENQKISWKLRAITFEQPGLGAHPHYYFVQKL